MKTYEEFRREVMADIKRAEEMSLKPKEYSFSQIETMAAKEYAKQWVVVSVALAGIDRPITKNELTVKMIEAKIDAQ